MLRRLLTEEELFCLQGCSSYKQYFQMRKGFEEGSCIFCNLDRNLNTVLFEDEFSFAWLVPEAYKRSELSYHALFVPKRHVRFEIDLTNHEVLSLHEAKKVLHSQFKYTGGCAHVREGDMRLNAGTVPHLHYNVVTPNGTGEMRIPIFKDPGDRVKNQERAAGFAAKYEAGEFP